LADFKSLEKYLSTLEGPIKYDANGTFYKSYNTMADKLKAFFKFEKTALSRKGVQSVVSFSINDAVIEVDTKVHYFDGKETDSKKALPCLYFFFAPTVGTLDPSTLTTPDEDFAELKLRIVSSIFATEIAYVRDKIGEYDITYLQGIAPQFDKNPYPCYIVKVPFTIDW